MESCSLCTHLISLPAYSDAGPSPGHCNIMAHPRFTLTSQAQTGFSSPPSFFTLSSTLTFTRFSLSPALSFHIFFYLILTFAIFQCAERENSSSRSPLLCLALPPPLLLLPLSPLFCVYISRDMPGNRSLSSHYTLFSLSLYHLSLHCHTMCTVDKSVWSEGEAWYLWSQMGLN